MSTYSKALIRGVIGGAFTALVAFSGAAPSQGPEVALYLALGAFGTYVLARLGEGGYDATRKPQPEPEPEPNPLGLKPGGE